MFQPTASEFLILKQFSNFSDCKSIEETELFRIFRSMSADKKAAKNDEKKLQTFKNALFGCVTKKFIEKSEKDGKSFYKITDAGRKQI